MDAESMDYDTLIFCYLKVSHSSGIPSILLPLQEVRTHSLPLFRSPAACGTVLSHCLLMLLATTAKTNRRMTFSRNSSSWLPPNSHINYLVSTYIT